MDNVGRPLAVVGLGAVMVAATAGFVAWWMEPSRRITRALASRLGGQIDALATAPLRGQGVGLRIVPQGIAVVRKPGDIGLAFGFEELLGVELIFDGEVRARAFRNEPRRPLDVTHPNIRHLCVRLVFDDLRYPDFELQLLHPDDSPGDLATLIDSGRKLFAHLEAIVRQPRAIAPAHIPPVPELAAPVDDDDVDKPDAPPP